MLIYIKTNCVWYGTSGRVVACSGLGVEFNKTRMGTLAQLSKQEPEQEHDRIISCD